MQIFAIAFVLSVAIGLVLLAQVLWRDAKVKMFAALADEPVRFATEVAPRAPLRQPVRTRRTNLPMPVAA